MVHGCEGGNREAFWDSPTPCPGDLVAGWSAIPEPSRIVLEYPQIQTPLKVHDSIRLYVPKRVISESLGLTSVAFQEA